MVYTHIRRCTHSLLRSTHFGITKTKRKKKAKIGALGVCTNQSVTTGGKRETKTTTTKHKAKRKKTASKSRAARAADSLAVTRKTRPGAAEL
jgi:hypothetical protein